MPDFHVASPLYARRRKAAVARQNAWVRSAAKNARIHSSFAGAIATIVPPNLALPPSWLHLEDAAACAGRAGV